MKDITKEQYEDPRSGVLPDADFAVNFCLQHLYDDETHESLDILTDTGLTYEELIGALLAAREKI